MSKHHIKPSLSPTPGEIAKMIDHSVLHPTATDSDLTEACRVAMRWNVASLCVKPCDVPLAVNYLVGTTVKVCTVIGFPHGTSALAIKHEEAALALNQGAKEIDMVVNLGKILSGSWDYAIAEVDIINALCKQNKALLKVIFENDFIPNDHIKIQLTKTCRDLGVDFVKTSTGFGFTRQDDGSFAARGATMHDCSLMVKHAGDTMKVKASGGIKTLEDVLAFRNIGVTRIGTSSTQSIMNSYIGSNNDDSCSSHY
jgi:deoxyribose-phosphate aldolase